MGTTDLNEFDKQLLARENPFRYPDAPERPPFMVGGERYLRWISNTYNNSIKSGYEVSFIRGGPGAGKTHLLHHLDYLFYEKDYFNGIYTIYRARRGEEINEKNLWVQLLLHEGAIQKLQRILPLSKISGSKMRLDVKENLLKLMNGGYRVDLLDSNILHAMIEALSQLLVDENVGICVAIDNVDEYFRFLSEKYGKEKALDSLLGMIRSVTTGLRQIVVLLACTTEVYNDIKSITADRTLLRRIRFQEESLNELTKDQCLMLVHKFMQWWAERHNITLPLVPDCVTTISTGQVSIYPFL